MHFRDKKLLKNTNRKPYAIYWMVPLSMTLSDLWPDFQVTTFLKSNIGKTARLIRQSYYWKLYLTCGMVYYVWWPWLTSKRVARVCQNQLELLVYHAMKAQWIAAVRWWTYALVYRDHVSKPVHQNTTLKHRLIKSFIRLSTCRRVVLGFCFAKVNFFVQKNHVRQQQKKI